MGPGLGSCCHDESSRAAGRPGRLHCRCGGPATYAGVVFDKPSGRIVEAFAEGAVSRQAVLSFYDTTLPQLGWSPQPDQTFQRDGERLLIKVREGTEGVTVEYRLSPE